MRICLKCSRAEDSVYSYCDDGWAIVKLISRAEKQIAYYEMDHPDNQGTLF